MNDNNRCEYCGAALASGAQSCPGCGAPNPHYDPAAASAPAAAPQGKPVTIAELRAFCAAKQMPLEKMRFFIGTDERSPRAFGIYREGSDYIVYKNKADGSRAIRYRGPDEAFAVNELYMKLLEEHRLRSGGGQQRGGSGSRSYTRSAPQKQGLRKFLPIILAIVAYLVFVIIPNRMGHRNDGYYMVGSDLFYRYGTSWYFDAGGGYEDGWTEVADFPYEDSSAYFQGSSYDSDWGSSSFQDSWAWEDIQDNSGSGSDSDWDSDYDSWDSGDTDWDSDW